MFPRVQQSAVLEPAVTLTDFALSVLNSWFAWRVWRCGAAVLAKTYVVLFFAAIASGALLGALSHGFFPQNDSIFGSLLWKLTMLSIGVAAIAAVLWACALVFGELGSRAAHYPLGAALLLYGGVVIAVRDDFAVALIAYVPCSVFLLVGFVLQFRKAPMLSKLGIAGLLLTFVAAWIQHAGIALHPVYFDHNATYHLVQAVGLLLLYRAARRWLGREAGETGTRLSSGQSV